MSANYGIDKALTGAPVYSRKTEGQPILNRTVRLIRFLKNDAKACRDESRRIVFGFHWDQQKRPPPQKSWLNVGLNLFNKPLSK